MFIQRLIRTYVSKKFLIFVFCGGMGTLTNFVFSLMISTKIDPTIAYIFGYSISLFVAYFLNSRLNFKQRLGVTKFLKFVVSYMPNFVILFLFVFVFLNIFNWNKVIVYALASLFGLPITFILVKIYAFKRGGKSI